jgi:SAM-dependent methyltransferase
MSLSMGFEERAHGWLAWARTPGHDAYWTYRDAFFDLVPAPGAATLEVGCGEGRVARDLVARGHRVTGLDASPTLVSAAAQADPRSHYVVGPAEALPFDDGAFDLVVAYNSLMDVDDMPVAVRETARVLAPGGRLCACITHPLQTAGSWEHEDDDAPFVVSEAYLDRRRMDAPIERNNLHFTFESWCYPLEAYTRALEEAGLLIEAIREPADPAGGRWARVPMFLMWRTLKAR